LSSGDQRTSADPATRVPALEIDGVWKYYGHFPALDDESERALREVQQATGLPISEVLKRGLKAIRAGVREQATRQRIGVLGHGISVYDELSALENLTIFAKLYGLPQPEKRAIAWLERTGLDRVRDGLVREFSRGMRQRLAVARAFLHEPDVLLMDEPFTALDDRAIAVLQDLLNDAHAKGRTIVMSTHQLREALELATDVVLIQRGQIAHAGPRTQEMVDDTGWLYRTYGEN